MSWPRRVEYQGCYKSFIKCIMFMPLSEFRLIIMMMMIVIIIIIIITIIIISVITKFLN